MNNKDSSREAFLKSPFFSTKHDSYFEIYDEAVAKLKSRPTGLPTIVEVGILHGGSLFMWRELFGPGARIIGVDLNPLAKKWENYDFEIFIGNQSDVIFWDDFYKRVGPIDFLVDDGGHTNRQQIVTTISCLKNLNPGGLLLIEDTNSSFHSDFANPSKYSFLNFCKKEVDFLYEERVSKSGSGQLGDNVERITFLNSVILIQTKDSNYLEPLSVDNQGARDEASDFRYRDLGQLSQWIKLTSEWSARKLLESRQAEELFFPKTWLLVGLSTTTLRLFHSLTFCMIWYENRRLRRFWKT